MNKCVDCFYMIESKNYENTIWGALMSGEY